VAEGLSDIGKIGRFIGKGWVFAGVLPGGVRDITLIGSRIPSFTQA
jgi:hypothetical protein